MLLLINSFARSSFLTSFQNSEQMIYGRAALRIFNFMRAFQALDPNSILLLGVLAFPALPCRIHIRHHLLDHQFSRGDFPGNNDRLENP